MIKIIHSSILCKWGKPTKSARDQLIIAPTVHASDVSSGYTVRIASSRHTRLEALFAQGVEWGLHLHSHLS